MMNKWLLRFGASVMALALVTGCGMNNNDDDLDPIDDAPLNEEGNNEDMMDRENGNR